ncbi:hypothetical protein DFH11DRAFT_1239033 [Phellopilus nigrolimitatus]|nr:hypothetical protein DFH11DRAFT_1239033 [Phellopilus nigrolimitatus]
MLVISLTLPALRFCCRESYLSSKLPLRPVPLKACCSLLLSYRKEALLSAREKAVQLLLDIWDPVSALSFLVGRSLIQYIQYRFIGEYELFSAPSLLLENDADLPLRFVHTKKGTIIGRAPWRDVACQHCQPHNVAYSAALRAPFVDGYMIGV